MAATACDLRRRSANEVDRGGGVQWWGADGGCRKAPAAFPSGSENDTLPYLLPREQIVRILSVLVAPAALFAATAPAAGASRADWDACKGDDPDRSIAACTRIIQGRGETAKDSAIAHHERGLSYKSKGEFGRANADLSDAIRLDPNYAEAYYLRGVTYGNKGDIDRAIADFSESIRLEPKVAAARYNRGRLYQLQGNNEPAIADFSEAIRLDPKFVPAYNDRGLAYHNQRPTDPPIAYYNEAVRLEPKFADPK